MNREGIACTWSPPLNAPPGVLYRLLEGTSSAPYTSAVQIGPDTSQSSIVIPKSDTTQRYYWVVAVDPITGTVSAPAPPSNGVPAAAASFSSALTAFVTPGSATVDGFTSTLTTPTVTVTASSGTAPYTYATTFTSGGSGISILNGTTTTPSFQSTGLAEGDVKSGTARIRVTDNVAATFDVFVAVTISRLYNVTLIDTTMTSFSGSIGLGGDGPAITQYTVGNDGQIGINPGTSYQWKNPAASGADYDVKYTLNSGTLDHGVTGVKQQLSPGTGYQVQGVRLPPQGIGTSTQNLTVEIYLHNSPFTLVASCTLIMNQTLTT